MKPEGPLSFIAMIAIDTASVVSNAVNRSFQGGGAARPPRPPLTLEEKNMYRAMTGGSVLAGCGYVAIAGWPPGISVPAIPPMYMAAVVIVALILLAIGLRGAKFFPVDPLAVIVSTALAVAGLVCLVIDYQPFGLSTGGLCALVAACALPHRGCRVRRACRRTGFVGSR